MLAKNSAMATVRVSINENGFYATIARQGWQSSNIAWKLDLLSSVPAGASASRMREYADFCLKISMKIDELNMASRIPPARSC